jgi:aminoglycoside 6'-N-acetyltransferase
MMNLIVRPLHENDSTALRAIRQAPEVCRWWDDVEDDFPMGDEPEATRYAIELDSEVIGMVQYGEETEAKYGSASIDIFLDPKVRGRGIAPEALRRVMRLLIEKGHHRITIDPAAGNTAAVRAYEKAGFRKVGVMKQAERDADGEGWHDSLLMEWVAGIDPQP